MNVLIPCQSAAMYHEVSRAPNTDSSTAILGGCPPCRSFLSFAASSSGKWPLNNKYYAATVVDYDANKHLHKVLYDEDSSMDELCILSHQQKERELHREGK